MKFLLNALLFSGALAASSHSFYKRETTIAQLSADIGALSSKVEAVGKAVDAFNGDAQQAVAIQTAAKDLTDAVTKSTEDAKGLAGLKQEDALVVAQPVQDLEKVITSTINSLIEKKDLFVKAGLGGAVHEILEGQSASASALIDALVGKLPTELKSVGEQLAAPVTATLKRGIDAFAGLSGSVASAEAALTGTGSSTASTSSEDDDSTAESTPAGTAGGYGPPPSSEQPPTGTAGGYGPPPSTEQPPTGTTGGYGPPPSSNTTTPPPSGRNQTNTTIPITPYTGAAPSTTAASAASAFGISAVVALVALAAL